MEELQPLCQCGSIVPPDEIIKLTCLRIAVDHQSIDPLVFAREMYKWVKEGNGLNGNSKTAVHDNDIIGG